MQPRQELDNAAFISEIQKYPRLHNPRTRFDPENWQFWENVATATFDSVNNVKARWELICKNYKQALNQPEQTFVSVNLKKHMGFMRHYYENYVDSSSADDSDDQAKDPKNNIHPALDYHIDISFNTDQHRAQAIWCEEIETECRKQFLLSLLEDMDKMTLHQSLEFKATLTSLVENILSQPARQGVIQRRYYATNLA